MSHLTLETSLHRELCQAGARLPSSACIFERINQVLRDPDVSSQDIINIIEQDPAVALRVLRLANSVQFVRGEPFDRLELAIDWVGIMHIYHLMAVTASANLFSEDLPHYHMSGEQVWRNAIAAASAMQLIAESAGEDPKRAYCMGLFRPVGRMLLQRIATRRGIPIPDADTFESTHSLDWEVANFGINNAEAFTHLFESWKMHASVGNCIEHHYAPEAAAGLPDAANTALLHVACWLADAAGFGLPVEGNIWTITPSILAQAKLTEIDLAPVVLRTKEITTKLTASPIKN